MSIGGVWGYGLTPDVADRTYPSIGLVANRQPDGSYTYTSVPATDSVHGLRAMIAGPVIEVHVSNDWSVEVSALHKMNPPAPANGSR